MVAIYAGLYLYLNFSGKLPARVETSVFAPVHKVYGYLRGLTPAISPTSGETDVALADLEAHLLHPATEQTAAALPGRQPVTNLVSIPRQSPVMIHAIKRGPHSALYLRAARFHDFEIDTYRQYNGRMSIPVVNLIEQACRQAIRDFKTCREAQLNQQSVEPYIQQCYQALADAQLSAKVPNQAGVAANSLPALPSLELPPEASNTPASTATAPTVAP